MFGKFDMNLVNERQILLERYLKNILSTYIVGKSTPVTNFFQKSNDLIVDYSSEYSYIGMVDNVYDEFPSSRRIGFSASLVGFPL